MSELRRYCLSPEVASSSNQLDQASGGLKGQTDPGLPADFLVISQPFAGIDRHITDDGDAAGRAKGKLGVLVDVVTDRVFRCSEAGAQSVHYASFGNAATTARPEHGAAEGEGNHHGIGGDTFREKVSNAVPEALGAGEHDEPDEKGVPPRGASKQGRADATQKGAYRANPGSHLG